MEQRTDESEMRSGLSIEDSSCDGEREIFDTAVERNPATDVVT